MHRPVMKYLPPHPEVELLRSQLMDKLRKQYEDLCMSREGQPQGILILLGLGIGG